MYPWPSFGGFQFTRAETAIFGTDQGWALTPSYSRSRPLGSSTDVITTLSIGSADRTFECYLTQDRFTILLSLLNTKALFTDWKRPTPDSRSAFLSEVTQIDEGYSQVYTGPAKRLIRTRIVLISA